MNTKRAALYLRVSTSDQHTENQRPEVERVVATRKLDLVHVYEESVSAAKRRPEFDRMLDDARRGKFDVLVIWAIDRFGRNMFGNIQAVLELDRIGVQIVSVQEPWLDTGGPVRPLLVAIFSWVAEQDRARLIERTNAGLDRARRKGVTLGRPKARVDMWRAERLLAGGASLRSVAAELGVPLGTLHRALERSKKGDDQTAP